MKGLPPDLHLWAMAIDVTIQSVSSRDAKSGEGVGPIDLESLLFGTVSIEKIMV